MKMPIGKAATTFTQQNTCRIPFKLCKIAIYEFDEHQWHQAIHHYGSIYLNPSFTSIDECAGRTHRGSRMHTTWTKYPLPMLTLLFFLRNLTMDAAPKIFLRHSVKYIYHFLKPFSRMKLSLSDSTTILKRYSGTSIGPLITMRLDQNSS